MEDRPIVGIATTFTLFGAIVAGLVPTKMPYTGTQREFIVSCATHPMVGALIGATIGFAIDFARNGRPKKSNWQFSLKTLMFAVVALSIWSFGVRAFLEFLHLEP